MLVTNVRGERVAATIVKNSAFYIEVAKFVQAYTTIITNPNEFLPEVGESVIDETSERLTWNQFVKIVQGCDLGFETVPSATDLVVYYNYALEIGSLDHVGKRLASVDDIANAQKHYYNFVDEAAEGAEAEYQKKRRASAVREAELKNVDSKLMKLFAVQITSFIAMLLGVFFLAMGVSGFFFNTAFVRAFGSIIPVWERQYVGAIILSILGLVLFFVFDRFFIKSRHNYIKLNKASDLIFKTANDTLKEEEISKHKLDRLKKDLSIVQAELADKTKKYDVKHNIERLKVSNKYYQKLCEADEYAYGEDYSQEYEGNGTGDDQEEFAPVKLTKEQEENLHTVSKEAINLEGVLDEEAYNEKFEKSEKDKEKEEEIEEEKQAEEQNKEKQEQEKQESSEVDLAESLDYLKDILGLEDDELEKNL